MVEQYLLFLRFCLRESTTSNALGIAAISIIGQDLRCFRCNCGAGLLGILFCHGHSSFRISFSICSIILQIVTSARRSHRNLCKFFVNRFSETRESPACGGAWRKEVLSVGTRSKKKQPPKFAGRKGLTKEEQIQIRKAKMKARIRSQRLSFAIAEETRAEIAGKEG